MSKAIIAWALVYVISYGLFELLSNTPKEQQKDIAKVMFKSAVIATVITIGFVLFVTIF